MDGIIIVNKPDGMTSHDIVTHVRRKFKMKRVGHAGTLDPLATGVLIVLLGKATKLFSKFVALDKAYQATMVLGTETTSADIDGKVIGHKPYQHIARKQVEDVFEKFIGDIEQIPPMVSAVKMAGQKLYHLARRGIEVKRKPRQVCIKRLEIEAFNPPEVKFYLECSKGTYVRQLADDAGKALGCGACISQIQRTKVGAFSIEDAVDIKDLNESHIRRWED
ncbi:MAG: tRNA pseudouridine(55) synthase TruB [Candidatus Omnitrophica bacterium]|nr:tRNA pseudouridine(55) synthase TruB [Candidatus Omnitrophota bacterium]